MEAITYKTEVEEIITLEEIAVLFDTIKDRYTLPLVSLSIFPEYMRLREKTLKLATKQRNFELSKLLAAINNRKQEIKINMWKTLSLIANNKKLAENKNDRAIEIEQSIYEEEQTINVYENSINSLDHKEKAIMTGCYSRVRRIKKISPKKSLKKQLEFLKERIMKISAEHNYCFNSLEADYNALIDKALMTSSMYFPKTINPSNLTIDDTDDGEEKINYANLTGTKEYYLYEPNSDNLDDELIFQLLAQGQYNSEDGTINCLLGTTKFEE